MSSSPPLAVPQWIAITIKMQRKRDANFCLLLRLYNSRKRAKETFQFAPTRWPGGHNCKSPIMLPPSSALWMTVRAYFPSELAICARGDAHWEKGQVLRDECMCLSLELFSCLQMGECACRKVSSDSAVASSFMCLLALPWPENIRLNWRLLTYAACAPRCHIGNSWRKALKSKGRKDVHA